jgi:tetratricopeptide (TPR) repeat protein
MPSQYAFISYSNADSAFVQRVAEELKKDGVWVDTWNMDVGEPLVSKIETGIAEASEFLLVLSKSSLASRWVKFESHMAVIRSLEDSNFRIVVVRIDDCNVPLRFKPFLYVDGQNNKDRAIARLKEFFEKRRSGTEAPPILFRRHFIDRTEEIGRIEDYVNDSEKSLICVYGLYGIGKRALVTEAVRRLWQAAQTTVIRLSKAHFGARLCLELCSAAGLELPPDGTPQTELERKSLLAAESIIQRRQILVFDQLQSLLNEDGEPHTHLLPIISHLAEMPTCFKVPVFLLSSRRPRLNLVRTHCVGYVKLSGLETDHLVTILENETSRITRQEFQKRSALYDVAEQLYGYPLAGQLAAPLLAKYSPDYLLSHLSHIKDLRIDIAEAILAHAEVAEQETRILEALAVAGTALSVENLGSITKCSAEDVVRNIDSLADQNLMQTDGAAVKLHPLVADFYWKQARSGPTFGALAGSIGQFAKDALAGSVPGSPEYVAWLATAIRMMFLTGDFEGARRIRRDLIGELKFACIDLYQRGDYELALRYCNEYLPADPTDFDVLFHKARCLSRLQRSNEALDLLKQLVSTSSSTPKRRAKLHFAMGRTYLEMRELEQAKECFLKALHQNSEYVPALQGISEVLLRLNQVEDAAGFLERALRVAPMDSFALSTFADLLWRRGKYQEAVQTLMTVVKAQPKNATFLFRLGRFLQQTNSLEEAYAYFRRAKESDGSYLDVRLSLASVAIDLGKLGEAEREIESIRERVVGEKQEILRNIEAQLEVARGNLEKARTLVKQNLARRRDVATLGMMAKIEIAFCKKAIQEGARIVADSHKQQALKLIEEGLENEPANPQLLRQRETIASMQ